MLKGNCNNVETIKIHTIIDKEVIKNDSEKKNILKLSTI